MNHLGDNSFSWEICDSYEIPLSPWSMKGITTKAEDRNSLSYKYMAIWKALEHGLPWYVTSKNIAWLFLPPLPTDVALRLGDLTRVGVSLCLFLFSVTSINVVVLETIYFSSLSHSPYHVWLYCPSVGADESPELFPSGTHSSLPFA